MEKLIEKLEKNKENLEILLKKREKINQRIKNVEIKIKELEKEKSERELKEIHMTLNSSNLTIIELKEAIETGDFVNIQNKLKESI